MEPWVFREVGHAEWGDARLTLREMQSVDALSQHPEGSLPDAFQGDAAGLKASYRFFDNDRVDPAALLPPHQEATRDRCLQAAGMILVAQDTTYFNFTGHPSVEDLGPIEKKDTQGLIVHSALAMTSEGVPLGIVAQKIGTRDPADYGKAARHKQLPIEEKARYRWLETIEAVHAYCPPDVPVLPIADREADIYDLFVQASQKSRQVLIRGSWNRRIVDHPETCLWPAVEAAPI
jgi:hypothetical protein